MNYTVHVDDNFHYMDKDERYTYGKFETLESAIEACRKIVDEYLNAAYTPGMSAFDLFTSYTSFGDDPWISGAEEKPFSAWDYARQRCNEICLYG